MTREQLEAERDRLKAHINMFNVNTPKREEHEKRIKEIERALQRS